MREGSIQFAAKMARRRIDDEGRGAVLAFLARFVRGTCPPWMSEAFEAPVHGSLAVPRVLLGVFDMPGTRLVPWPTVFVGLARVPTMAHHKPRVATLRYWLNDRERPCADVGNAGTVWWDRYAGDAAGVPSVANGDYPRLAGNLPLPAGLAGVGFWRSGSALAGFRTLLAGAGLAAAR